MSAKPNAAPKKAPPKAPRRAPTKMSAPVRARANTGAGAKVVGAKQAILDAALRAFARTGFDGASLPKIAEMAGLAHPLIHYHFGSKENLWRETVAYACDRMVTEVSAIDVASRGLAPLERLRVLVQTFTHFAARHPDSFGIVIAEARSGSERVAWLRENYADPFVSRLIDTLRDAQKKKQIKTVPLDHLLFTLLGSMMLYFTLNFRLPAGADKTLLADRHAEIVWEIFTNGIALKKPKA